MNEFSGYQLYRDLESVKMENMGGYGFGTRPEQNLGPKQKAWKKELAGKRKQAQKEIARIKNVLKSNKILIYSYGFEKEIDYKEEVVNAITNLKRNKECQNERKIIKKHLNLTSQEEKIFLEELE